MFCTNQNFQSTNRIVRWWISSNKKNFAEKSPKEKLLPNIFGQVDLKYFSGRLCCRKARGFLLGVFVSLSDTKKRKSLKVLSNFCWAVISPSQRHTATRSYLYCVNNKQELTPCYVSILILIFIIIINYFGLSCRREIINLSWKRLWMWWRWQSGNLHQDSIASRDWLRLVGSGYGSAMSPLFIVLIQHIKHSSLKI